MKWNDLWEVKETLVIDRRAKDVNIYQVQTKLELRSGI